MAFRQILSTPRGALQGEWHCCRPHLLEGPTRHAFQGGRQYLLLAPAPIDGSRVVQWENRPPRCCAAVVVLLWVVLLVSVVLPDWSGGSIEEPCHPLASACLSSLGLLGAPFSAG